MSEGSTNKKSRVSLKGLSSGSKGTYRGPASENAEDVKINKGQSTSDVPTRTNSSSVGEKTHTRETQSSSNYHIEMSKIRTILNRLRAYSDVDQDKLSTSLKDDLYAIKQIYMSIDAETGRDQISCLIDEIFGDINLVSVLPNTVAAFFLGCKTSNCNGVPLGCSPQCANSLPSDPNLTGYAPCDAAVYLLKDGVLTLSTHGTGNSGNAYVYVDNKFTGYSTTVVQRLSQNGVKAVKTVRLDGGKCGQMSQDFIALARLAGHKKHHNDDSSSAPSMNNFWMWVLVALLVLLVIGGIWALATRGKYTSEYPSGNRETRAMMAAAYGERNAAMNVESSVNKSLSPEFFRNMANTFSSPMSV